MNAHDDARPVRDFRCERCGTEENCETFDGLTLCERCLLLILKEWRIRRAEFGELAAS